MKIYKNEYGFSTCGMSKDLQTQEQTKLYYAVQFKKGTEPIGEIECDLILKAKDGTERPCFLSNYKAKDGTIKPKIVVMGAKLDAQKSVKPNKKIVSNEEIAETFGVSPTTESKEIKDDDLPFY